MPESNEYGGVIPANLGDLHDVARTAPAIGDTIIWDGTTWAPGAPAGAPAAEWLPYVPALTASGTNPVLGVGSVAVGQFWEKDGFVHGEAYIKFGTSGNSVGSGVYSVSLPPAAPAATPLRPGGEMPIGVGWSMPIVTHYIHTVELQTATTVVMRVGGGGELLIGPAQPAAWGPGGEMTLSFGYRKAA